MLSLNSNYEKIPFNFDMRMEAVLNILIRTFDMQVLNLTELELNRVDIRVGLSGALYFMDGSPQAVRQLRNLVSQVLPYI